MIRGIVAIDEKRGMADENGIPWDIPGDKKYFVDHLQHGLILMGYSTYLEVEKPWGSHDNYVASRGHDKLRDGFVPVADAAEFLHTADTDVWDIGGPGLLASTLDQLDELYVTQLEGDFHCTKFLPPFRDTFDLASESEPLTENGVTYRYQRWTRRR